jgi:hypothetical protein
LKLAAALFLFNYFKASTLDRALNARWGDNALLDGVFFARGLGDKLPTPKKLRDSDLLDMEQRLRQQLANQISRGQVVLVTGAGFSILPAAV